MSRPREEPREEPRRKKLKSTHGTPKRSNTVGDVVAPAPKKPRLEDHVNYIETYISAHEAVVERLMVLARVAPRASTAGAMTLGRGIIGASTKTAFFPVTIADESGVPHHMCLRVTLPTGSEVSPRVRVDGSIHSTSLVGVDGDYFRPDTIYNELALYEYESPLTPAMKTRIEKAFATSRYEFPADTCSKHTSMCIMPPLTIGLELLLSVGTYGNEFVVMMGLQICRALLNCRTAGFIYCDLQATNVYVNAGLYEAAGDSSMHDYVENWKNNLVVLQAHETMVAVGATERLDRAPCTSIDTAPEARAASGASFEKADVWGFGRLLWRMMFRNGAGLSEEDKKDKLGDATKYCTKPRSPYCPPTDTDTSYDATETKHTAQEWLKIQILTAIKAFTLHDVSKRPTMEDAVRVMEMLFAAIPLTSVDEAPRQLRAHLASIATLLNNPLSAAAGTKEVSTVYDILRLGVHGMVNGDEVAKIHTTTWTHLSA